jgi:hypothetical protein
LSGDGLSVYIALSTFCDVFFYDAAIKAIYFTFSIMVGWYTFFSENVAFIILLVLIIVVDCNVYFNFGSRIGVISFK